MYFSLFFTKNIKSSIKLGRKDEELDLLSKYKIKKVLGEVLLKFLRIFSESKYEC